MPETPTLLQAAADYLEGELLPTLQDYHRLQTRVTDNPLRLVERELRLASVQQQAKRVRLMKLTDKESMFGKLYSALGQDILVGNIALTDYELLRRLHQTLREALYVHNAAWPQVEADDPRHRGPT